MSFSKYFLFLLALSSINVFSMQPKKLLQQKRTATFELPPAKIIKTNCHNVSQSAPQYIIQSIDCNEYLASKPTNKGYFTLRFNKQEDCVEIALLEDFFENFNDWNGGGTVTHQRFFLPLCTLQPTSNMNFKRNHHTMPYQTYADDMICSHYEIGIDTDSLVAGWHEKTNEITLHRAHCKKYSSPVLYPIKTIGLLPDDTTKVRAIVQGQKSGHTMLMLDNNMVVIFIAHLLVDVEKLADLRYNFQ